MNMYEQNMLSYLLCFKLALRFIYISKQIFMFHKSIKKLVVKLVKLGEIRK
jgi:hypothetical protein